MLTFFLILDIAYLLQNVITRASDVPEIWLVLAKILTVHVT